MENGQNIRIIVILLQKRSFVFNYIYTCLI